MRVPGRLPDLSRCELILDMSREDVQDYILEKMSSVISRAGISYVKWDFNRSVCDKYSHALPASRQGEMAHRFVLGTYRVLEGLLTRFPELLLEGCSGGGGRFDCGMLYYTPQIWCSDNTDPIERLTIQYGTSFIYPVSTMGAHVSASPNHQTGRLTPMETRTAVAMSGTFGYELDPTKLQPSEQEEIRREAELELKERQRVERELAAQRIDDLRKELRERETAENAARSRQSAAEGSLSQAWGWYRDQSRMQAVIDEQKAQAAAEVQWQKDFERLKTWRRDWRTAEFGSLSASDEAVRQVAFAKEEKAAADRAVIETAENTRNLAEKMEELIAAK